MYNRDINDDMKAREEIVSVAVSLAKPVGTQAARGNTASVTTAFNSATAAPSGVTADGKPYFPFLLDVDTMDTEGPYL